MKNGSLAEKLKMQEKEITNTATQQQVITSVNLSTTESIKQSFVFSNAGSLLSIFSSGTESGFIDEHQPFKPKKKKKRRRIIS